VSESDPLDGTLSDLPLPAGSTPVTSSGRLPLPKPPKPHQLVYFYSPDEWEEFILEYASGLEDKYYQIKRIGGSNDRGADIAAFLSPLGFDGEWDCLQCKHYEQALMPSDAYPEIFKVLRAVVQKHYTLPRRYMFLAPKSSGPTLSRLLSTPSKIKAEFLKKFDGDKPLGAGLDNALVTDIKALAESLDYSMFRTVEPLEIFDVHRRTRFHVQRFDAPLPDRPAAGSPPEDLKSNERRYVEHLLAAYSERHRLDIATPADIEEDPKLWKHFGRQREAFYSAEALRIFARDSVADGTFEELQEEVYQGVIETHFGEYDYGLDRLKSVLEAALALNYAPKNPLVAVSVSRDKRGICHQLANGDRLIWCEP
jgi:hypothetical protein